MSRRKWLETPTRLRVPRMIQHRIAGDCIVAKEILSKRIPTVRSNGFGALIHGVSHRIFIKVKVTLQVL